MTVWLARLHGISQGLSVLIKSKKTGHAIRGRLVYELRITGFYSGDVLTLPSDHKYGKNKQD